MAEESNNNIIVSRIQHRRGLKQDLPQPLRPGELGLATDSRQLYIGSDPNDPQSSAYNAVSYFENTVGSRDYTRSVANNQILAFQVPFVMFTRGEFGGTTFQKGWQPTDARSIMSGTGRPECKYSSSDYTVFSSAKSSPSDHTLMDTLQAGATVVELIPSGLDTTGNIRVGDHVKFPGSDTQSMVVNVVPNSASNKYTIKLSEGSPVAVSSGETITFIPQNAVNFSKLDLPSDTTRQGAETKLLEASFVSTDVIVRKNGIKLIPEANASVLEVPTAAYDYTIDGSNTSSVGTQYLTLRTRPSANDQVTVCYYGNANVIQAFEGIPATGKIAPNSPVESFYSEYAIPEYRHIPRENIRVSDTTGLGYIGLQQKHIVSVADGTAISDTSNVALGDFLVARLDQQIDTTDFARNPSSTLESLLYTITINTSQDVFSPVADSGVYRYNRVLLNAPQQSDVLDSTVYEVISVTDNGTDADITVQINNQTYDITRPATANLVQGSFTDQSGDTPIITFFGTEADGINENDYVRIVDAAGDPANCELHGAVFQVLRTTSTSFTVNADTNISGSTTFTANIASVYFVNHGSELSDINSTYQLRSVNHGLTDTDVTQIVSVEDSSGGQGLTDGDLFDIDTTNQTANTFFVVNNAINTNDNIAVGLGGLFRPDLVNTFTGFSITPVLAVDLSSNTTVKQAIATMNKELVSIPKVNTDGDVQIFPQLDWLPKADNVMDTVFLSQKPSYTSIETGGLEFALYDDSVGTVSALGLTPGKYTSENNTVKAKLENWMNSIVNNRDVNLFTNVFTGGELYAALQPNHFGTYNLNIDDTFGEITFCDRMEAEHFNFIVNSAYSESPYDRAEDDQNGTRGLVNLKNNLEIQTREAASVGEKILTYTSLESTIILQSDTYDQEVFGIDATKYNTFVIDYSMSESPAGSTTKYMRSGTITVTARPDFTDAANAVVFSDNFNSHWEVTGSDPVVEPQFQALLNNGRIEFSMLRQYRDPGNPAPGDYVAHTIDSNIKLKYVFKRWSSTD